MDTKKKKKNKIEHKHSNSNREAQFDFSPKSLLDGARSTQNEIKL